MTRLKLAELTSGVGALMLGIGFGALLPAWFGGSAWLTTLVGLFLHAFGMWDKHRLERQRGMVQPRWLSFLYWTCWLLLAAVLLIVLARGPR
jgi:hypothetical protein